MMWLGEYLSLREEGRYLESGTIAEWVCATVYSGMQWNGRQCLPGKGD